ncbi:MAG: DUF962 domain-containing protein [Geothrix sp.]|nr:DUF962 domain-containing protein [Geothrix sp.]
MLGSRPMSDWIQAYGESHQHPVNRACHTVGIPLVTLSILLLLAAPLVPWLWKAGLVLFGVGWFFQFLGHAVEGKPPEFFKDWRFLLVGLRWWALKVSGRVPPAP